MQYLLKEAVNPWLLPALGLGWVLASGGVDLSVWVVFGLGSVVAARIAAAGAPPLAMLAGATAVGVAVGTVHAAAVGCLRLPSWGVTLITAIVGASVVSAAAGGKILALEMSGGDTWPGATRPVMLTATFYAVAMLAALLLGEGRRPARKDRPLALASALSASAVLSALGGLCWLVRSGWTPRPGYLVADLRAAAAAVLAGAVILTAPGRKLVAGVLLVPAMLLVTIWRQSVWYTPALPAETNLVLLMAMALAGQCAWRSSWRGRGPAGKLWAGLAAAGIVALAASAWDAPRPLPAVLRWGGVGMWGVGIGAAAAGWLRRRTGRPRSAPPPPEAPAPSPPMPG